jgi:hypothetical protein
MLRFIGKWWIFVLIGIIPTALGDYGIFTWQWWITAILLIAGVNTHHSCS